MEFAEKIKEFTHKSSKPTRSKYMTSRAYNCNKCREHCVFSRTFFEKCSKYDSLRINLDEKFYAAEFEYLRSLYTKQKLENNEQTNSEYSEGPTTFDLLKIFHSLEKSEKNYIGKLHNSKQYSLAYQADNHISKLIKRSTSRVSCTCRYCSKRGEGPLTRQKKNTNLVFNNMCDVKIEC